MAVSPLFGQAIEAALRAGRLSDGLVDPTVGRAMRAVGYDRDFGRAMTNSDPLVLRLEPVPGWQSVAWDPVRRVVSLRRGVELDLGLDRQGARGRPVRGSRPRCDGSRRHPRQPRWRHRDRRRSAGGWVARPRGRRQRDSHRRQRRGDRDPGRRAGDLRHDLPTLDPWRDRPPSHHRSPDRAPGRRSVADRLGRGRRRASTRTSRPPRPSSVAGPPSRGSTSSACPRGWCRRRARSFAWAGGRRRSRTGRTARSPRSPRARNPAERLLSRDSGRRQDTDRQYRNRRRR